MLADRYRSASTAIALVAAIGMLVALATGAAARATAIPTQLPYTETARADEAPCGDLVAQPGEVGVGGVQSPAGSRVSSPCGSNRPSSRR